MDLRALLTVIAAIITTADCTCSSITLYATTSLYSRTVYSSSYDYCSIKINPSYSYSSSYYLELSWSSFFDVKGDMPFCKEDYVEVFLTSSYRSIGKFCSNNAGTPFTMYSRDRYARIVHSTNGYSTGRGFKFYFRLKHKSSYPLGGYTPSSSCYNMNNYATSGVIYSTGWPSNYQRSSTNCVFQIVRQNGYQGAYVVFMDINMYYTSYYHDCVQLFASNHSTFSYQKTISTILCNMDYMKAYRTYSSYLKIIFNRNNKPSMTLRGFVAGYVMFKKPTEYTTKTSSNSTNIVLGVVIPIIIIAIIIIAVVVYTKKRQRPTPVVAHHNQSQTATIVSTQRTTTHQMPQAASSMHNVNYAYNKTQYVYPTATMQSGNYPQGSYPMSYATGPSYPTGQFTTSPYTTPQVSFMVAPPSSSAPVAAVQPPLASGCQGQQPSGTLNPSYDGNATALIPGNAPPPIEAPNVPPPTYQAATSS